MKRSLAVLVLAAALVPFVARAQTPAPQTGSFSITANAVALPGSDNSTLAGTLAGINLRITSNFNLEQTNFVSSAAQTNAFLGGGAYTFGKASKALNSSSPNLNGYDFRFSIHGDFGAARITQPSGTLTSSWSGLFGGQIDYAIRGSKTYSLGVRIDDFFVPRGLPHRNNLVVALGPTLHF